MILVGERCVAFELGRARQQDVAIRQIEGAREPEMREVRRQVADDSGGQIDLHGVAKRFGEKQHPLAVERELGTLTEPGQLADVR